MRVLTAAIVISFQRLYCKAYPLVFNYHSNLNHFSNIISLRRLKPNPVIREKIFSLNQRKKPSVLPHKGNTHQASTHDANMSATNKAINVIADDAISSLDANSHKTAGSPTVKSQDPLSSSKVKSQLLVDIGVNLTNRAFCKHWENVVTRSIEAGVKIMLLTGTSVRSSRESLDMARAWSEKQPKQQEMSGQKISNNLYVTIGVHPHDAKTFTHGKDGTIAQLHDMLTDPLTVAVGECGLDYNRNFSSKEDQQTAFREQVSLACELDLPMFIHEREAHEDLVRILDEFHCPPGKTLPPIVVHCFTGTLDEAMTYVERGFYIGFTGVICKKERGAPLREILPHIPLERIMLETDAPFMGFVKGRRRSEPADVVGVADEVSRTLGIPFEQVCAVTTANAISFFKI